MVDAAVGGKTGINTGAGKNLVGSFHEPAGVLCDLALLDSLPRAELVSGLGEVVKCGFIADPEILELVEAPTPPTADPARRCCASWSSGPSGSRSTSSSADLKETGGADGHPGREVLNYGHTMAHAIERRQRLPVRHGEAVAHRHACSSPSWPGWPGMLDDATARPAPRGVRPGRACRRRWYGAARSTSCCAAMAVDKKARGSQLRFVVLDGLGAPAVLTGPDRGDLRAAYDRDER